MTQPPQLLDRLITLGNYNARARLVHKVIG
jgi:hypothetical protein